MEDSSFDVIACIFHFLSLVDRIEHFFEGISQEIREIAVVFVCLIDHVVDNFHDLLCVIAILCVSEGNSWTTDKVILNSTLIVNLRKQTTKSDVWSFNFSLWVLLAQEIEDIDWLVID